MLLVVLSGGSGVRGQCDYCVLCQLPSKEFGFQVFQTFFSGLRIRIWGLLGQGIGDMDLGLTKMLSLFNLILGKIMHEKESIIRTL